MNTANMPPADATAAVAAVVAAAEVKKMAARVDRQWQRATDDALAEIAVLQASLTRMAEAIARGEAAGPVRGTAGLAAALATRDALAATRDEMAALAADLA